MGLKLYVPSAAVHDGENKWQKVQIKIPEQDNIVINHEPVYLIVMYLNIKRRTVYEVYMVRKIGGTMREKRTAHT